MLRVEPLPRQGLAGPGAAVNLHTQCIANLAAPYMVNSSHVDCENDRTPTDPFPPSLLHRQQQTRLWSYPCNRIVSVASNAPSVHTWEPARTANIIKFTMSSVHMQSTTTFCTWKRAIAQVLRCSCSLHKWVSEASDYYLYIYIIPLTILAWTWGADFNKKSLMKWEFHGDASL